MTDDIKAQPTTFTRDEDDKPMAYLPAGAQIHHHQGTADIPPGWAWLTGRKEPE